MYGCDTRNPGHVLFNLSAHDGPVSAMAMSHVVDGLLVTASRDQCVKVWDVKSHQPAFVYARAVEIVSFTWLFGGCFLLGWLLFSNSA